MPFEWVPRTKMKKKKLTKTNHALYKHLKARTSFLEMYGEWTYTHEFSTT